MPSAAPDGGVVEQLKWTAKSENKNRINFNYNMDLILQFIVFIYSGRTTEWPLI
jgi:hypothetical protein